MGERIKAFEWSNTPLGPIERWPAALVSTLSVCLTAQTPMAIYWGKDSWLLYNDAWRPIVGGKHPWALGKPARNVWPELWPTIQHYYRSVLTTGEANWRSDELLPMQRFGYTEECYFDYSLNPIRGKDGQVEGILNIVQETTYRVLNDRRTRLLRELASLSGSAQHEDDACALALQSLATDPADLPFALLYRMDRSGGQATLAGAVGLEKDHPARQDRIDLHERQTRSSWPLAAALQQSSPLVLEDLADRFGWLPGGAWPEPTRQAIILPITQGTHQDGNVLLIAAVSPRRQLDGDYRHFFGMVASQIAMALTNARAYQSEARRAEALAELDRAKTEFFHNVSHEFRTPLTLMLGPLEEELRERPQNTNLEVAHRNSVRLLKLVNILLDFSRIEAGRAEALYQPTDLAAYSADLASGFRSAIEGAGLTFRIDCPSLPQPVFVDRSMWEKIVLNLLSNAFKHTFQGAISLSIRHDQEGVTLAVRDTGVGIPDDALPRLFQRFYRVQHRRSRTHEGSGIGLALVQEIVRLHGGTVQVESRLDEGSTFSVTLPWGKNHLPPEQVGLETAPSTDTGTVSAYLEEAWQWLPEVGTDVSREEAPSPDRPAIGRARILVADDNADMRRYIVRLLREHYEVNAVGDGLAALAEIRRRPPDVLLSDIMMPQLDGIGLARILRADPALRTIPIILLSARAGEEPRIKGLEQGADDYLVKPFSGRELLARVSAHLNLGRLRREAAGHIAASEAQLRAIVNHATVTVAQTDLTGRFQLVNRRLCDLLGYTESELLGMRMQDVTDPEDLPRNLDLFQQLAQGGPDFVIEKRYRRKDGTAVWMSVSVGGVREGTDLHSIVGVGLDISDRKRQEAQLLIVNRRQQWLYELADAVNRAEPSSRLYEQALHAMADAVHADRAAILLIDDEGVMRFKASQGLSTEYQRAVEGHSPWTADQKDPPPLFIDQVAVSALSPELQAAIQREGIRALAFIPLTYGGRLLGKFMLYFDRPRRMTDEEIEWSQALATTLALAVARAQADEVLRASEERLRLAMVAGRMGAWDLNLHTGETTWDAKQYELFGRPTDRPVRRAEEFYAALHPDDAAQVQDAAARAMDTGLFTSEFRVVHQDGTVRWLSGQGATVTDDQGRPVRMIGINYDITERKQAEQDLQRFAAQLEHRVDERTLELTQSREQLRALATELNLAGQRERQQVATELHDYLAQLLALSRIRLAQAMQHPMTPPLSRTLHELQEVTDQALTYTRTLVAQLSPPILKEFGLPMALRWLAEQMLQRELHVSLDFCPAELALPEDQAMLLFQSIRELLMNVVKHAGTKDAAIAVLVDDGHLRITVTDHGAGFLPAEKTALPRQGTVPGFGLLSIRERMLALGGRFDLCSRPGQGTVATLVMPLATRLQPTGSLLPPHEPVTSSSRTSKKYPGSSTYLDGRPHRPTPVIRVLIADDHAMVRQGLCGLLAGYADIEVLGEAANGQEAVALTTQLQPDVVLMDVNMPGLDGIEATRLIKEAMPSTIVIGLSVQNAGHVGMAMREAGAIAFLNKEAAVEDLYHTILTARNALLSTP